MTELTWRARAKKCQEMTAKSLNPAWLVALDKLPPAEQLDVMSFIETCGMLTPAELEMTATSGVDLVSQMGAGKLTAVEVVTAFLKRAHIGHQLLNLATEFLVDDALAKAAELDEHFRGTGELVGPLHGLPISVKEHIGIKGRICHAGYTAWTDNVAGKDALILRLLGAAGAVFHVRTNEPQSLMHLDCSNFIHGTTVNPYNRTLSPGGSSGGEGASLGYRCSVMGIGSDIGGSVRCPAAHCGAYGLRTTALRNPCKGIFAAGPGQESIRCVVSPLANDTRDIDLLQRALLDQEPWEEETELVPIPWKRVDPYKVIHPHPPITRGLKYAVGKLKAAGVKVVDFEPYNHAEGWELIKTLYFPDAAKTQRDILAETGEPIAPLTESAFKFARKEPITVTENWKLNIEREKYRAEYHRLMKDRGVDFILCPAYIGVAAELGSARYFGYTSAWNILDQPAIAFPTGLRQDPNVDAVEEGYKPRSPEDEEEYNMYSPEKFVGAPISLQLVGKHFRDEETLAATDLVSKIIQA
ncbi:amidase [Geosmithia morbida]|uniref:amidase n=1 Tax=Geosmithia morbida TaxID=1094350 RepID=A0A9P5D3H5_9HYPO|nr:amidase [Geosmithia morbida]KAF4124952.1 amidase [Geosmithia morbida]